MNMLEKTAEEGAKQANGLLARIFGPSADGLGIMLSQPIKMRLVQNQIRNLEKLKNICEKEGVNIKQVDLKAVLPYLEGIALEEDPVLEELWANLMANYLDSEKNLNTTVYPSILKQISSSEAKALEYFYKGSLVSVTSTNTMQIDINDPEMKQTKFEAPVNNLYRLGLIEDLKLAPQHGSGLTNIYSVFKMYKISPFGNDFYLACQRSLDKK
jgi:hypothetical protein